MRDEQLINGLQDERKKLASALQQKGFGQIAASLRSLDSSLSSVQLQLRALSDENREKVKRVFENISSLAAQVPQVPQVPEELKRAVVEIEKKIKSMLNSNKIP